LALAEVELLSVPKLIVLYIVLALPWLYMPEGILTPSDIIDFFFIPYRPTETGDVRAHCSVYDG
jgi:hypothetical protein